MQKWEKMDVNFLINEINASSSFNEASLRIGYARCRKDIIKNIANKYNLDIDRFISLNESRLKTTNIGEKYGKWTVIDDLGTDSHGTRLFLCECECGNKSKVLGCNLRSGISASCGKCNVPKIGEKIGKLTVLSEDVERKKKKHNMNSYWFCQCDCGNIISVSQRDLKIQKSCGCLRSKANALIGKFLSENNIPHQREYSFSDLKGDKNGLLKFDFAIFNETGVKCLIEYQGKQHYEPIEYFGGEEKFLRQQKYDNKKVEYCKKNNINLIIIPYWEKDIIKFIKEHYYVEEKEK